MLDSEDVPTTGGAGGAARSTSPPESQSGAIATPAPAAPTATTPATVPTGGAASEGSTAGSAAGSKSAYAGNPPSDRCWFWRAPRRRPGCRQSSAIPRWAMACDGPEVAGMNLWGTQLSCCRPAIPGAAMSAIWARESTACGGAR